MRPAYEKVSFFRQDKHLQLPIVPRAVGVSQRHSHVVSREASWITSIEYLVSGSLAVTVNGITHSIRPGDVFILHRHSRHAVVSPVPGKTKKIYLYYERAEVEHVLSMHGLTNTVHVPRCRSLAPYFRQLWSIASRAEGSGAAGNDALVCDAAVAVERIIVHCACKTKFLMRYSPDVRRMMSFIDNRIHDPITLRDVSGCIGRSVPHAIRLFQRDTGITPIEYLISRRIENAVLLLRTTDENLRAIARRCGFNSERYFSAVLKKRLGLTPTKIRE